MNMFFKICTLIISLGISSEVYTNFNTFNNRLNFNQEPIEEIYEQGYLKLKKQNQNSTQEIGLPELPIYSTLYMVDPNKNYDFEFIVNESYIINDVNIFPYQDINSSDKGNNLTIDNDFYNSKSIL